MRNPFQKKPALGVGLGVGLLGTLALAIRHRMQRAARQPIPEAISPAIFATRVVQTTVGEIVYHVSGSGDPIIFLHGIHPGASSFEWSRVYPEFAATRTVIAPDLLGFGESERPEPGLDTGSHSLSIAELIRALAPRRRAVIVASGVSSAIALRLAAEHPDLVNRLVLYAPVGLDATLKKLPRGICTLASIPGLNVFVYKNYFARRPFIQKWACHFGFTDSKFATDEVIDIITTCAAQYGAERAIIAFLRGRLTYDLRAHLTKVTQPVTILWPEPFDRFAAGFPETLRAAIPRCEVTPAPPLGSLGPLEAPEELGKLIEDRLA